MKLIWATRGKEWGFRFLSKGGFVDALPEYERAFDGVPEAYEAFRVKDHQAAFRFPDPEGRRDASGRPIPHQFVVYGKDADDLHDLDQARELVWPQIKDFYSEHWDKPKPPTPEELEALRLSR